MARQTIHASVDRGCEVIHVGDKKMMVVRRKEKFGRVMRNNFFLCKGLTRQSIFLVPMVDANNNGWVATEYSIPLFRRQGLHASRSTRFKFDIELISTLTFRLSVSAETRLPLFFCWVCFATGQTSPCVFRVFEQVFPCVPSLLRTFVNLPIWIFRFRVGVHSVENDLF